MSKPKSSAHWWFLAHSWLALPIWVFLFFVCLTGSIATVSQEIVWLARPEVRANPPSSDARMLGYDGVLAVIAREHPGAIIRRLDRPVKSMFAWTVKAEYPDGRSVDHYVNPYTGHIQGSEPEGFSFRSFMQSLHGWLLFKDMKASVGWLLVSLLSVPLLGSLVTGLVVYKRFWRGYLHPRLRWRQGARVFWGDLHRLIAIWSAPFILIMAVTGLWFLTDIVLKASHVELPETGPVVPVMLDREAVPLAAASGQAPPRIGLDKAAQIMRGTFPGVEASFFSMGDHAFAPIRVRGQAAHWPLLTEGVWVDPYSGHVEYIRSIGNRSWLELVTQSMRPLHTGDFVGLGLKLVYLFFGLMLTTLVASGLVIWLKRTAKATSEALPGFAARWRRWRFHLSGLMLILPLALLPQYLADHKPAARAGLGQRVAGDFDVGPWHVTLGEWLVGEPRLRDGEYEKAFTLALRGDAIKQVKAAYIRLGQPRGDVRTSGALLQGTPYRMFAVAHLPEDVRPDAELWVTLEGWDGSKHRVAIALAQASPAMAMWARTRSQ